MDQRRVWTAIGSSFDATRVDAWPFVLDHIRGLEPGRRLVDIMAGNGRHAAAAAALGHTAVAVDWSPTLCQAARRRGVDAMQGDAACLPVPTGWADAVLFVAGLHGVADEAGRTRCMQEARRVLSPGGTALVSVWSRGARRFAQARASGAADVVVPWRAAGLDLPRHVHLYDGPALDRLAREAGFLVEALRHAPGRPGGEPENLVATLRVPA